MTDAAESSSPRSPARRRRRRRIVLLALLLFGVWLTRWVYLRLTLRPTPRPEYWTEQIERLDPPPPGAHSFETAMRNIEQFVSRAQGMGIAYPNTSDWETLRGASAWKRFPAFDSDAFFQLRQQWIDLARCGWRSPDIEQVDSMYNWDKLTVSLVPGVRMLLDHAVWSLAYKDDADSAVEDWLTVARLAQNCGRSRRYMSRYAENVIHRVLADDLRRWADEAFSPRPYSILGTLFSHGRHGPCRCPSIPIAAFASELDRVMGPELRPQDLCEGERLTLINALEHLYVREGGDWLDVSEAARFARTWMGGVPGRLGGGGVAPRRTWNLLAPVFHNLAEAKRVVEEQFWYPEGPATLPQIANPPGGVDCRFVGPLQGFPRFYAYPMEIAVQGYYSSRNDMEGATTLLALREFRLANGEFPETLRELVPRFLPRLPIDYGDRGILRYERRDGGFILYSVGWDGVDDGGRFDTLSSDGRLTPDIVFAEILRVVTPHE